jgi:hypothetical protein
MFMFKSTLYSGVNGKSIRKQILQPYEPNISIEGKREEMTALKPDLFPLKTLFHYNMTLKHAHACAYNSSAQ